MILNTKLHILEVTLYFMIHKGLKLVTTKNSMMFGVSLKRELVPMK